MKASRIHRWWDALGVADRFAVVAESLPDTLDQQREAFFKDLIENQENIGGLINDTQKLTADATQLFTQVDSIMSRVQELQTKALEASADDPPPDPNAPKGPPFDINDYTRAIQELDQVVVNANDLLQAADGATSEQALRDKLGVVESTVTRIIWIAAVATLIVGLVLVLAIKFIPRRQKNLMHQDKSTT